MSTKKKASMIGTIKNLILIVPALFGFFKTITGVIKYEASLAGKNLMLLLVMAVLFIALLASTWVCLLAMIYVYLTAYLHLSVLLALSLILLVNIVLMSIVGFVISKRKQHLFFPETSRQITRLTRLIKE